MHDGNYMQKGRTTFIGQQLDTNTGQKQIHLPIRVPGHMFVTPSQRGIDWVSIDGLSIANLEF